MREDHVALLHRRPKEIKLRRDLGARWQAGEQKVRSSRKKGRVHAAGNCSVRRIQYSRDDDVLRLDIRHVHRGDRREAPVPPAIPRSTLSESIGEESRVSEVNPDDRCIASRTGSFGLSSRYDILELSTC